MIQVQEIGALIPPEVTVGLQPEAVTAVLGNIAAAARNHWIGLAEEDPSSFRNDYIAGIQNVSMRPGTAVIALVGEVPHMLEDGRPREDLRDTLLGPNVPVVPVGERGKHLSADDEYYRAIPFRHMTPGAKRGKAAGRAMGKPYDAIMAEADAKKLGREVYKAAKALSASRTAPGGERVYGGRLKPGTAGAPLLKPHHKTDIYAGMIREEKKYKVATQVQYFTFRTISTGVRDQSWWRDPIRARRFAQDVADFAADLAPRAFRAYLEAQK